MLTDFVSSWFRSHSTQRWHVREVRDWRDLERCRETWEKLARETPGAGFLQSWAWFETYWRHFGDEQRLRVLIVEGPSGIPVGLVPLTIRCEPTRIGSIRRLVFPLDNWGTQYGPLGSQPSETLAAAFRHLYGQRREWDVIDLRWVPADQCPDFVVAWRRAGMHFQQKLWSRTARIDLSQGWENYWNSRPSKWRNNQRRCDKSLDKLGAIRVVHFRPERGTEEPRWDLFDLCEQIAAESWQGACPSGNTLNHPAVRTFLREAHGAAANMGCVHLSLLFVADRPAAFTYNYVTRGATLGLRMGYDLQFQAAGAGAVLMRETIRECCARGDHTFDLGESTTPYKRHLANSNFETYRFCHYSAASPLAHALRIKGWLANSLAAY